MVGEGNTQPTPKYDVDEIRKAGDLGPKLNFVRDNEHSHLKYIIAFQAAVRGAQARAAILQFRNPDVSPDKLIAAIYRKEQATKALQEWSSSTVLPESKQPPGATHPPAQKAKTPPPLSSPSDTIHSSPPRPIVTPPMQPVGSRGASLAAPPQRKSTSAWHPKPTPAIPPAAAGRHASPLGKTYPNPEDELRKQFMAREVVKEKILDKQLRQWAHDQKQRNDPKRSGITPADTPQLTAPFLRDHAGFLSAEEIELRRKFEEEEATRHLQRVKNNLTAYHQAQLLKMEQEREAQRLARLRFFEEQTLKEEERRDKERKRQLREVQERERREELLTQAKRKEIEDKLHMWKLRQQSEIEEQKHRIYMHKEYLEKEKQQREKDKEIELTEAERRKLFLMRAQQQREQWLLEDELHARERESQMEVEQNNIVQKHLKERSWINEQRKDLEGMLTDLELLRKEDQMDHQKWMAEYNDIRKRIDELEVSAAELEKDMTSFSHQHKAQRESFMKERERQFTEWHRLQDELDGYLYQQKTNRETAKAQMAAAEARRQMQDARMHDEFMKWKNASRVESNRILERYKTNLEKNVMFESDVQQQKQLLKHLDTLSAMTPHKAQQVSAYTLPPFPTLPLLKGSVLSFPNPDDAAAAEEGPDQQNKQLPKLVYEGESSIYAPVVKKGESSVWKSRNSMNVSQPSFNLNASMASNSVLREAKSKNLGGPLAEQQHQLQPHNNQQNNNTGTTPTFPLGTPLVFVDPTSGQPFYYFPNSQLHQQQLAELQADPQQQALAQHAAQLAAQHQLNGRHIPLVLRQESQYYGNIQNNGYAAQSNPVVDRLQRSYDKMTGMNQSVNEPAPTKSKPQLKRDESHDPVFRAPTLVNSALFKSFPINAQMPAPLWHSTEPSDKTQDWSRLNNFLKAAKKVSNKKPSMGMLALETVVESCMADHNKTGSYQVIKDRPRSAELLAEMKTLNPSGSGLNVLAAAMQVQSGKSNTLRILNEAGAVSEENKVKAEQWEAMSKYQAAQIELNRNEWKVTNDIKHKVRLLEIELDVATNFIVEAQQENWATILKAEGYSRELLQSKNSDTVASRSVLTPSSKGPKSRTSSSQSQGLLRGLSLLSTTMTAYNYDEQYYGVYALLQGSGYRVANSTRAHTPVLKATRRQKVPTVQRMLHKGFGIKALKLCCNTNNMLQQSNTLPHVTLLLRCTNKHYNPHSKQPSRDTAISPGRRTSVVATAFQDPMVGWSTKHSEAQQRKSISYENREAQRKQDLELETLRKELESERKKSEKERQEFEKMMLDEDKKRSAEYEKHIAQLAEAQKQAAAEEKDQLERMLAEKDKQLQYQADRTTQQVQDVEYRLQQKLREQQVELLQEQQKSKADIEAKLFLEKQQAKHEQNELMRELELTRKRLEDEKRRAEELEMRKGETQEVATSPASIVEERREEPTTDTASISSVDSDKVNAALTTTLEALTAGVLMNQRAAINVEERREESVIQPVIEQTSILSAVGPQARILEHQLDLQKTEFQKRANIEEDEKAQRDKLSQSHEEVNIKYKYNQAQALLNEEKQKQEERMKRMREQEQQAEQRLKTNQDLLNANQRQLQLQEEKSRELANKEQEYQSKIKEEEEKLNKLKEQHKQQHQSEEKDLSNLALLKNITDKKPAETPELSMMLGSFGSEQQLLDMVKQRNDEMRRLAEAEKRQADEEARKEAEFQERARTRQLERERLEKELEMSNKQLNDLLEENKVDINHKQKERETRELADKELSSKSNAALQQKQQDQEAVRAATKIQAGFRGFKARKHVKVRRSQSIAHMRDVRVHGSDTVYNRDTEEEIAKAAATSIQAVYRGHKSRNQVGKDKERLELQRAKVILKKKIQERMDAMKADELKLIAALETATSRQQENEILGAHNAKLAQEEKELTAQLELLGGVGAELEELLNASNEDNQSTTQSNSKKTKRRYGKKRLSDAHSVGSNSLHGHSPSKHPTGKQFEEDQNSTLSSIRPGSGSDAPYLQAAPPLVPGVNGWTTTPPTNYMEPSFNSASLPEIQRAEGYKNRVSSGNQQYRQHAGMQQRHPVYDDDGYGVMGGSYPPNGPSQARNQMTSPNPYANLGVYVPNSTSGGNVSKKRPEWVGTAGVGPKKLFSDPNAIKVVKAPKKAAPKAVSGPKRRNPNTGNKLQPIKGGGGQTVLPPHVADHPHQLYSAPPPHSTHPYHDPIPDVYKNSPPLDVLYGDQSLYDRVNSMAAMKALQDIRVRADQLAKNPQLRTPTLA